MLPNLNQRGSATVVALIFMALLAALAAGFGALVSSSIQISKNEQAMARAQAAAESGMEVVKSYLTQVSVAVGTPDADVTTSADGSLNTLVHTATDAAGNTITLGATENLSRKVTCIYFPYQPTPTTPTNVQLYPGKPDGFRATITPEFTAKGTLTWLSISVIGTNDLNSSSPITRQIVLDANYKFVAPPGIFAYGVMSNGGFTMVKDTVGGATSTYDLGASIMAKSVAMTKNNGSITGDVWLTGSGTAITGVGASGVPLNRVHAHAVPPAMPQFDPSIFSTFATNSYAPTYNFSGTMENVHITSTGPGSKVTIGNNLVVNGILYIDSPNTVIINNNLTINGAIVFANKDASGKPATPGVDSLTIKNSAKIDVANTPATDDFARGASALQGYAILAPTADVTLNNGGSGNASGNTFGSIICNKFKVDNGYSCNMQQGTLLTYSKDADSCSLSGNNTKLLFTRGSVTAPPSTGMSGMPPGSGYFAWDMTTYSEGAP